MEFFSTRGGDEKLSFEQAVLRGLAPNGGLYIPTSIPQLPSYWQTEWSDLSFSELAFQLLSLYIPSDPDKGGIPSNDLKSLVDKSYSTFRSPQVAPLTQLSPNEWCLELWHGPTFAFKDVALQLLGNLFEYFLKRRNEGKKEGEERERLTVLGATSGDTGSAAIAGLRSKKDINIFILHPKGRVSPIQEAQMTTVLDANVHNVAVEGTFDDCQDIVKACFSDPEFNARHRLGAINSINIARILAQITYYFSSYFELKRQLESQGVKDLKAEDLQYVVPTGNFGDILAGHYAKRMGLPVRNLVVATNENDILERFWKSGAYEKSSTSSTSTSNGQTEVVEGSSDGSQAQPEPSAKKSLTGSTDAGGVKATLSPAMDILVSSNFERLLWYLAFEAQGNKEPEKAGERLKDWMKNLKENGRMEVNQEELKLARRDFLAERVSDEETSNTILRYFTSPPSSEHQKSYLVDPHTAVGLEAATRTAKINPPSVHRVILSTAHPAKFSEAVTTSLESSKVPFDFEKDVLPKEMIGLLEKEKRVLFVGKNKEKPGLEGLIENTRKVVEEKVGGVSKDSNGINGTQSI